MYLEVLPRFKTKVVKQFCINTEYMQAHRDYFGEALDMCEEFGILEFINLHENFDEALIHQFYATIHFSTDQRSITWMTKDQVLSSSWADFATLLRMRDYGEFLTVEEDAQVFWISYMNKPMQPSALSHLLIQGRGVPGESKFLQKTWHIMHRIFRNTVLPRVGNFDQVHGRLIDLMVVSSQMMGKGKRLDVMDILWNEIHEVIMKRTVPIFGALIMKLILRA